jgi:hypothetical protein
VSTRSGCFEVAAKNLGMDVRGHRFPRSYGKTPIRGTCSSGSRCFLGQLQSIGMNNERHEKYGKRNSCDQYPSAMLLSVGGRKERSRTHSSGQSFDDGNHHRLLRSRVRTSRSTPAIHPRSGYGRLVARMRGQRET